MTDIWTQTKATAEGRWEQYLEGKLGMDLHEGKPGTCPVCGGEDRFQFHDNRGGGNWYCRGEKINGSRTPHYGDGIALATEYLNKHSGETYSPRDIASDVLHYFKEAIKEDPQAFQKAEQMKAKAKAKRTEAEQETFERIAGLRTEAKASLKGAEAFQLTSHPYFRGKRLEQTYLCAGEDVSTAVAPAFTGHRGNPRCIVVDYVDLTTDEICGVETIAPDGTKRTTGRKGAHLLPYYGNATEALVVEGFATGVALNSIIREDIGLASRYRVVVAGGCGMAPKIAEQMNNRGVPAYVIYEDDGQGTPEGELAFPVHNGGNDCADWLHHEPTVKQFIDILTSKD